jgi:hypothetical protein
VHRFRERPSVRTVQARDRFRDVPRLGLHRHVREHRVDRRLRSAGGIRRRSSPPASTECCAHPALTAIAMSSRIVAQFVTTLSFDRMLLPPPLVVI